MPDFVDVVKSAQNNSPFMLTTLHKYIFREMGKTFALTAIGLTFVLSTCGGAVSIIPLQSLSARQTLMLLALVVPISAAFTLPIAALFSATITYGRMAADNEFTAVRSSGINTVVLFLPCLLLSLVSAIMTFVLFNFLIPGLMGQARVISQESIKHLVARALRSGEVIDVFQNYRIQAETVTPIEPQPGAEEEIDALFLEKVAFIEFKSAGEQIDTGSHPTGLSEIVRFGTSETGMIKFLKLGNRPRIEASLTDITLFDPHRRYEPRLPQLLVGPFEYALAGRTPRPKHLSLPRLLDYKDRPEEVFRRVQRELHKARTIILSKLLFDHLVECLTIGTGCRLTAAETEAQILAGEAEIVLQPKRATAWVQMSDLAVEERPRGSKRHYRSKSGRITLQFDDDERFAVTVALTDDVRQWEASDPGEVVQTRDVQLGPFEVPPVVLQRFTSGEFDNARLWDKNVPYSLGPEVQNQRKRLRKERSKYLHQIFAEIHVRTVYSISVLVLAVLGAALGIIFKGGQILVAFGISFVPTLFVILMTIVGKNIAKGEDHLMAGLAVMWLGLVAVIILDSIVFKRYLPR